MNSDGNCSPLNELAVAQFAKPPELGRINLRVLTPFQRSLLAIDGTVTTFIEAYMQEPVEIRRLSQTTVPLIVDHPWLEMPKGAMVVKREVLIEGKYSRTLYVYASSLVVLETGQTVSTTFNVVCDAHVVQALENRTFSPATLRIRVGDTVRWENNSGVSHNVAADDGSFRCSNGCDGEGGNGNPATSWSFTRTFNTVENIAYQCEVHGAAFGMVGQIIVQSP